MIDSHVSFAPVCESRKCVPRFVMLIQIKMASFSTPATSEIIGGCLIRSGSGSGCILSTHMDVWLPSHFRYDLRIGTSTSFEIQRVS
jgi:hypothetical protein